MEFGYCFSGSCYCVGFVSGSHFYSLVQYVWLMRHQGTTLWSVGRVTVDSVTQNMLYIEGNRYVAYFEFVVNVTD